MGQTGSYSVSRLYLRKAPWRDYGSAWGGGNPEFPDDCRLGLYDADLSRKLRSVLGYQVQHPPGKIPHPVSYDFPRDPVMRDLPFLQKLTQFTS